jgi:hypothetical protein
MGGGDLGEVGDLGDVGDIDKVVGAGVLPLGSGERGRAAFTDAFRGGFGSVPPFDKVAASSLSREPSFSFSPALSLFFFIAEFISSTRGVNSLGGT